MIRKWNQLQLLILADQPGPVIAYKLVTDKYTGASYAGLYYTVGAEIVDSRPYCDNPAIDCGCGINLATMAWVLQNWVNGQRIMQVECFPSEGICIPNGTDGKFRVQRCKVLKEMDLAELGLVDAEEVDQ